MPVFEPSVNTTNNQQQLTGILVPVLVMLGGIGISYGIYTALRWFSFSRRGSFKPTGADAEAMTTNVADNGEKSVTITEKQDSRQDSSTSLTSTSVPTSLQPPAPVRIGSEAILARKAMKIKESLGATRVGKRGGLISIRAVARPRNAHLGVSNDALAEDKENTNPFIPKQPSPLKNGYKSLVLGTTPVVAPRVPEPLVHPVHGYRYF